MNPCKTKFVGRHVQQRRKMQIPRLKVGFYFGKHKINSIPPSSTKVHGKLGPSCWSSCSEQFQTQPLLVQEVQRVLPGSHSSLRQIWIDFVLLPADPPQHQLSSSPPLALRTPPLFGHSSIQKRQESRGAFLIELEVQWCFFLLFS